MHKMGSLNPENEPKQELDDSGYVQEDTATKEAPADVAKTSVNLLELSDDVLLYILRYCSPVDLKALGYTCTRLGTLVLDRTLWQRVDARGTATGRQRMRWLLTHALSVHTTSLKLSGYARESKGCLGYMSGSRDETQLPPPPMCPTPEEVHPWSLWNRESMENELPGPRLLRLCAQVLPRYGGGFPYWPEQMRGSSAPPRAADSAHPSCPGPQETLSHAALLRLTSLCSNLTEIALEHVVIDCNMTKIGMFPKSLRILSLLGTKCFNLEKSLLFKIQDHLVNLEELDASECEWVEPACMLPLSKLPRLQRLYMRLCPKLTEFVAYASLATRYGFKQLRVLDLRGSPVGDSEVSALGWVPLLEQLYLAPAPPAPRAPAHAHFSQDPPPTYRELHDWEEQEPEYYRGKYESEPWIEDEKNGCHRGKRAEPCPVCMNLPQHVEAAGAARDQPAPSGSADTGPESAANTTHSIPNIVNGMRRTVNICPDSNVNQGNREASANHQDTEQKKQNNAEEKDSRKRKQENDEATATQSQESGKHFKKRAVAASENRPSDNEPTSSDDACAVNVSSNCEPSSDSAMISNTKSSSSDSSQSKPTSSINEPTSSINQPTSSVNEPTSSINEPTSSTSEPRSSDEPSSSMNELASSINDPVSSDSFSNSDEPSMAESLDNLLKSINNKITKDTTPTKGARKHFDATDCQVSRSTLKDSLDDFKNRTETFGGAGSFDSDDNDSSLDDDDDDDDDKPEAKRCRLDVGASTSFNANYLKESKPESNQADSNKQNEKSDLKHKGTDPASNSELSESSNNVPNSSSKDRSPDSSQSPTNGQAPSGSSNTNEPGNDKNDNNPTRTKTLNTPDSNNNPNEPSTSQEGRSNQTKPPQRYVRFRINQPSIFTDARGNHVLGEPQVMISGRNQLTLSTQQFAGGCRNPIVVGGGSNEPPAVIACGNNPFPFIIDHGRPPAGGQNRDDNHNVAGGQNRGDNQNVHNNNDAQQPDWNNRLNPGEQGAGAGAGAGGNEQRGAPSAEQGDLSRERILYVNVGRRRHAMYQISMPEPVDLRTQRPLTAAMNLIYSSHVAPRLEYASLVTDAAVRRFGRADGENINYVQIGPMGPVPAPYDDPHARPNRSNLRILSVTGYRHVTNVSLTHLATAAPHLQMIDFTGTRVTEAGVEHFRNLRPDCRVRYGPVETPKEDSGRPHSR